MPEHPDRPASPVPRPLVLVAAVARNRVIGADNALPWRLPGDLRRFRALTSGHTVVMGRRTFESIGKPLPERENIVVSRSLASAPAGTRLARSLEQAMAIASRPGEVFCIGGSLLYQAALARAERLELTEIDADFAGDAWFPRLALEDWREISRIDQRDDASGLRYAFVTYVRRNARSSAA